MRMSQAGNVGASMNVRVVCIQYERISALHCLTVTDLQDRLLGTGPGVQKVCVLIATRQVVG